MNSANEFMFIVFFNAQLAFVNGRNSEKSKDSAFVMESNRITWFSSLRTDIKGELHETSAVGVEIGVHNRGMGLGPNSLGS